MKKNKSRERKEKSRSPFCFSRVYRGQQRESLYELVTKNDSLTGRAGGLQLLSFPFFLTLVKLAAYAFKVKLHMYIAMKCIYIEAINVHILFHEFSREDDERRLASG